MHVSTARYRKGVVHDRSIAVKQILYLLMIADGAKTVQALIHLTLRYQSPVLVVQNDFMRCNTTLVRLSNLVPGIVHRVEQFLCGLDKLLAGQYRGVTEIGLALEIVKRIVLYSQILTSCSPFGGDHHHSIGCPGAPDGSRGGIFEHSNVCHVLRID